MIPNHTQVVEKVEPILYSRNQAVQDPALADRLIVLRRWSPDPPYPARPVPHIPRSFLTFLLAHVGFLLSASHQSHSPLQKPHQRTKPAVKGHRAAPRQPNTAQRTHGTKTADA
jgi:hypothetical protein